ncbi:hypothetical protein HQ545_04665 [Candidatus Woesearchaeota archaeon]|nr:hypothetical protein [Candidatus Woesearchaeota archaeon]
MTDDKRIPIEVSNRHVHLSRKDVELLFGTGHRLKISKNLSQPGQFAAEETVNLMNGTEKIENVRVVGPERDNTQVEISMTDAIGLSIEAL